MALEAGTPKRNCNEENAKDNVADGITGLAMDDFKKTPLKCVACEETKAKRMSFKRQQETRATEYGVRLMSDVCYVKITTPGIAKYFQVIEDETSRFKWFFMGAAANVMNLIRQLEEDFNMFSFDQGGEFLNTTLTTFLQREGIQLLTSNAYTPEETCLVEKLNGKLLRKVRTFGKLRICHPGYGARSWTT